jgi:RimJ/RimL family protein N-acetyltransferase
LKVLPVTLTGPHVRLEPLSLGHLDALCAIGLDAAIWEWSPPSIATRADMRAYIETALERQSSGNALPFATVEISSETVVGSTRFGAIDTDNRRVEIGWTWIAPQWQQTVINTEAKYLMLRHAFEELGCIRVEFKTDALNERSRRAILRLGAKEEGTLREHMITSSGRRRDSVYYSILESEWPDVKAFLEGRLAR